MSKHYAGGLQERVGTVEKQKSELALQQMMMQQQQQQQQPQPGVAGPSHVGPQQGLLQQQYMLGALVSAVALVLYMVAPSCHKFSHYAGPGTNVCLCGFLPCIHISCFRHAGFDCCILRLFLAWLEVHTYRQACCASCTGMAAPGVALGHPVMGGMHMAAMHHAHGQAGPHMGYHMQPDMKPSSGHSPMSSSQAEPMHSAPTQQVGSPSHADPS